MRVFFAPLVLSLLACTGTPPPPPAVVAPKPPPRDDGKGANGVNGSGGNEHFAALEQLKVAPIEGRTDKQDSLLVPLPDGPHWTRVRFWGVPSLVGFRYGKDHHAVVGAFLSEVEDSSKQGICGKNFEAFAQPFAESFDVEVKREKPQAFAWRAKEDAVPQIIEVEVMTAKTATLAARDDYAGAYAVYPVWDRHCLAIGIAVPARGDMGRAKAVRDRFITEAFPKIVLKAAQAPEKRF
jgi:hypothetical protein